MVQTLVKLGKYEDRVLMIVKGKYGFSNKSDAVNFIIGKFEEHFLEPQLRPEYAEKLGKIEKEKGIRLNSIGELRRSVEDA
jgi:hypothetical protein